jgi:hypothetical protein
VLAVETTVFSDLPVVCSPLNRDFYAEIDGGCSCWEAVGFVASVVPCAAGSDELRRGKRADYERRAAGRKLAAQPEAGIPKTTKYEYGFGFWLSEPNGERSDGEPAGSAEPAE